MWSILLLRHHEARKHLTAASYAMGRELRRDVLERRERATKLRCSKMFTALSALSFLASGAMAQVPEMFTPALSRGLPDATPVQTLAIGKLRQSPATESLLGKANLPPIESIGSGSNIRPFLASGVPADLTRAALRRAWSVDPAIRDFIGLSENSWDFNAPGGVPGFGPLTTDGPEVAVTLSSR
jgi:hypothetical protein